MEIFTSLKSHSLLMIVINVNHSSIVLQSSGCQPRNNLPLLFMFISIINTFNDSKFRKFL